MTKKAHNHLYALPTKSGGEPPMSTEARLSAIEAAMPYLATKENVANLRADTYKWLIGTGVAVVVAILGAILPFLIPLFNSIAGN